MAISRPQSPHSANRCRSNSSPDSQHGTRETPQVFFSPDSSKPDSLNPQSSSRRVLFSYQHVLFLCRKSAVSLSSAIKKRTTAPEPVDDSITKPNAQPKSILSLKLERLKDKWHGFIKRTSPKDFRCAGFLFFIVIIVILACIIAGWYGLSKDTISHHKTATLEPTQTTPTAVDDHESFLPVKTPLQDQLPTIIAHRDITKDPAIPTDRLHAANANPTTSLDEADNVTVVKTVIATVTSVITDTALKTLTTTVIISTCTTCITTTTPTTDVSADMTIGSQNSTTGSVMTGIMYCSFTGRRNIYTLCPLVHTDSPGMLTDTPAAVSSATPRMKNSFTAIRLAIVSLWNAIPSLGRVMHAGDHGRCGCDCSGIKRKLEAAVDLIRMQQRLLESQRAMISEHRRGIHMILETLANLTAARAGDRTPRDAPLDLNI
ncbi:hypothetical protein F5Y01DRAFT_324043 [Xylaria sp. FL0043]|nr:hypothetical protein F5Y01DRAFT_324043 [Xylaria sp. FL0043]